MNTQVSYVVELSDGSQLYVEADKAHGNPVILVDDVPVEGLQPFSEDRPPSGVGRRRVERPARRSRSSK